MGLWGKVAGWSMMIGGVVAAPYTGGASLALTSAGGKLLSADAQKEAAKKAETQLTDASTTAIGTLTQARDASAAAYAPYTQTGGAAMNALGAYMGLPAIGDKGPPKPSTTPFMQGLPLGGPTSTPVTRHATPETATGTVAVPRGGPGAPTPQTQAIQQTASGYVPLGNVNAGLVQMRAPDGTTQYVPRQQAPFYAARGAVEVG